MAKASRDYTAQTLKILFGRASHCAYPGCTHPLIVPAKGVADEIVLAQICHIIAASDNGPRGDPDMSLKARSEPDNLLLMCPTHHIIVDAQHAAYPASLLRDWKALQQRETVTGLAPYRAAIARYVAGELSAGALFRRRADAPSAVPRLETIKRDGVITKSLAEAVTLLDRPLVAIIGGSGSGKTTFLHQVATSASETPEPVAPAARNGALPLIVNCSRFAGSLPALIASEARNATGISIDLDGMQGLDFPLNLYCDDFQYCPDKKALLEQLRALTHQHQGARCAILTHELADYGVLERFSAVSYRIAELDDEGLLDVFTGFMDEEAADALLDDLAARGEIEAFRQPVLATLVAVAHADMPAQGDARPVPLRRGELLRRVVGDGVLKEWLASRSPDLTSPHADSVTAMLAGMAAALVHADKELLPQSKLVPAATRDAERLIAIGISCGLMRRHDQQIGFAHAAIRDYFAAEWLLKAPPRRLARAWFSTRWHGALRNFASLWVPDRRRLAWLRLSGKISLRLIVGLRVAPQSFATRLFYLMLEFAAESRIDEPWLQLGIFNHYRHGHTFLDESAVTQLRSFIGGWEDKYAHVYRLLGRLRHPEIDAWLRTSQNRRYAMHGIRQDTSEAGLETLLRGLGSDDDGLADDVAVELAFEYPKAMLRRVVDRLLDDPEVRTAALLGRISRASQTRRTYPREEDARGERRNRIGSLLSTDVWWRDRMLVLTLGDPDEQIAEAAHSVLRRMDEHGWMRADAEAMLAEALKTGPALVRERAVRYLVYGKSEESKAALIAAVRSDADIRVATSACGSLLYRDTRNAPAHYLTILRRFGNLDPKRWQERKAAIAEIVDAYVAEMGHKPYKKYVRAFLAYLHCSDEAFDRIVAADGLHRIRGRVIATELLAAFEAEADQSLADHLIERWATHSDVTTDRAITYLIALDKPGLRSFAAQMVRRGSGDPSPEVIDLIRRSVASEQDAQVRYDLGRALDYIKVGETMRERRERAAAEPDTPA